MRFSRHRHTLWGHDNDGDSWAWSSSSWSSFPSPFCIIVVIVAFAVVIVTHKQLKSPKQDPNHSPRTFYQMRVSIIKLTILLLSLPSLPLLQLQPTALHLNSPLFQTFSTARRRCTTGPPPPRTWPPLTGVKTSSNTLRGRVVMVMRSSLWRTLSRYIGERVWEWEWKFRRRGRKVVVGGDGGGRRWICNWYHEWPPSTVLVFYYTFPSPSDLFSNSPPLYRRDITNSSYVSFILQPLR